MIFWSFDFIFEFTCDIFCIPKRLQRRLSRYIFNLCRVRWTRTENYDLIGPLVLVSAKKFSASTLGAQQNVVQVCNGAISQESTAKKSWRVIYKFIDHGEGRVIIASRTYAAANCTYSQSLIHFHVVYLNPIVTQSSLHTVNVTLCHVKVDVEIENGWFCMHTYSQQAHLHTLYLQETLSTWLFTTPRTKTTFQQYGKWECNRCVRVWLCVVWKLCSS